MRRTAFVLAVLAPALAFAQGTTINVNLPGTAPSSTGIGGFVSNFYSFALLMSGILAFGAIVWGGIRYAAGRGNPTSESEGKSWITGALLGLLLLAGAWIILYTVNPNILSLQLPGLPTLGAVPPSPTPTVPTPTTPTGGTCSVITNSSNPCSISSVQSACSAWNPNSASQVCNRESGGGTNPNVQSQTDKCNDGVNGQPGHSFSIGLWQINVISTPGVPSSCSFSVNNNPPGPTRVGCGTHYSGTFPQGVCLQCGTNSNGTVYCSQWSCSFNGGSSQYNNCVSGVAAMNDQLACTLYQGSYNGSFCPWSVSAHACGVFVPCP